MKYNVLTSVDEEKGRILQEVVLEDELSSIRETISRRVIDTQEEQARQALIRLGWTPPKEEVVCL